MIHFGWLVKTILSPSRCTFTWWGDKCFSDLNSYADWSVMLLVGPPKSDRLKGRGQTKQHRPSAGTLMLGVHCCAYLHGVVDRAVPPIRQTQFCAPLHNGRAGVNPQGPILLFAIFGPILSVLSIPFFSLFPCFSRLACLESV